MDGVGVELRRDPSRYLALVAAGETIEVTDRGRPVALLVSPSADRWQGMIAYGIYASARLAVLRAGDW